MRLIFICIAFTLTACATNPVVLELAETTAVSAAIVSGELKRYAADQAALQNRRNANIEQFARQLQEAKLRAALDRGLLERTGDSPSSAIKKFTDLLDFVANIRLAHEEALQRPAVETQHVADPVEKLGQLAKTMLALSQDNDLKTDARFIAKYIKQVADDVKSQRAGLAKAGETIQIDGVAELADTVVVPTGGNQ